MRIPQVSWNKFSTSLLHHKYFKNIFCGNYFIPVAPRIYPVSTVPLNFSLSHINILKEYICKLHLQSYSKEVYKKTYCLWKATLIFIGMAFSPKSQYVLNILNKYIRNMNDKSHWILRNLIINNSIISKYSYLLFGILNKTCNISWCKSSNFCFLP